MKTPIEELRSLLEMAEAELLPEGNTLHGLLVPVELVREIIAQPVATDTNVSDKISKFIDGLEVIFADLRERHVDDSVCGLCEYDGAYMGQSGDWCGECPGFDRDDCFKLSDKIKQKWKEQLSCEGTTSDTISRQEAIDRFNVIRPVDPKKDEYTKGIDVGIAMCIVAVKDQPTIQPELAIPVTWIEKHIEWLKSLDNEFANLAAAHISAMVKKWRDEQDETD